MAKDKKSFILYSDQKEIFNQLPDDVAGRLIKHIFAYVNDENPKNDDLLINIAFTPIKQQLKRDLVKFEEVKSKKSDAGKAGANARWNGKRIANDGKRILSMAKMAVNDNVNDNDNDNVNDIYKKFDKLSITKSEIEKLKENYTINQINDVLLRIENYRDNKKYKSLYLTCLNWLKKEPVKQSIGKVKIPTL